MIKKWKELFNRLEKADAQFSAFLEAGIAPSTISKLKPFISDFNKLKKTAVDFEELMIPVEPIEVHWPFDDDMLRPVWDYWKNYLIQQHGIRYGTYAEQEALEYLHQLHEGDSQMAKQSLKYSMANLYSRFFKVKDNENTQQNKHQSGNHSNESDRTSHKQADHQSGAGVDLREIGEHV